MQVFHTESKIIVTCNKRLSPYLQSEIEALGFTPVRVFQTGVELKGTVNDTIALNLNLRCASQVLYLLNSFTAANPQQLYEQLQLQSEELESQQHISFPATEHVKNRSNEAV